MLTIASSSVPKGISIELSSRASPPPPRSSSLILRLELSTLTRLFNGDQSQMIALCYYLGVDLRNVVLEKAAYIKFSRLKA